MRRLFVVFIFKNGVSVYMFLRKQLTETIVGKEMWHETIANASVRTWNKPETIVVLHINKIVE
jgi:hypothetical protein